MSLFVLRPNQLPGEYYCSIPGTRANGAIPGQMQYHFLTDELKYMNLSEPTDKDAVSKMNEANDAFEFAEHTDENILRLIPNTKTGTSLGSSVYDWHCILMMQRVIDNGNIIWLKGALRNNRTGELMLMTSTNHKSNLENGGHLWAHSQDPKWFIGRYRMSAPMKFWSELKKQMWRNI